MTLLIVFLLLSIGFSFLCSIWEAVLLSVTPSYVNSQVQQKTAIGKLLHEFKDDIDRPLSAILTLNTIAHTVGAIGVGAQAGKLFGTTSYSVFSIEISTEAVIATLMTLAILILSEIIPKTIGANSWKKLAPFTVYSLRFLLIILAPLVWLSQLITKRLKKNKEASVFSRADFKAMTIAGKESGALKENESKTIENVLRLEQIQVTSIMSPRSVMLYAKENDSTESYYQENTPIRFSRIPVFDKELKMVTGILLKEDLYQSLIDTDERVAIDDIMRSPQFIESKASLADLDVLLQGNKNHLVVVTDDFGLAVGLVTLEDLMETILGMEIVDEIDDVTDLQELARKSWNKRRKIE